MFSTVVINRYHSLINVIHRRISRLNGKVSFNYFKLILGKYFNLPNLINHYLSIIMNSKYIPEESIDISKIDIQKEFSRKTG